MVPIGLSSIIPSDCQKPFHNIFITALPIDFGVSETRVPTGAVFDRCHIVITNNQVKVGFFLLRVSGFHNLIRHPNLQINQSRHHYTGILPNVKRSSVKYCVNRCPSILRVAFTSIPGITVRTDKAYYTRIMLNVKWSISSLRKFFEALVFCVPSYWFYWWISSVFLVPH